MRLFILFNLVVGVIAVLAPDEGTGLTRSIEHGFGWESAARLPTASSATGARESPRGRDEERSVVRVPGPM